LIGKETIVKKRLFVGGLFVLSIIMSGCIVVSSNKTQSPPQECPKTPQTSATIAEIDAAGKLHTDSAKLEVYRVIARRPNLSEQERIYLLNAAQRELHTDSAKKEVLMILVNNHPPIPQPAPRRTRATKLPVPCTAEPEEVAPKEPPAEK
jgi:hypothetical protein